MSRDTLESILISFQDKPLIKFKNHFYFEEKDGIKEATKGVSPLQGSKITFFKNGECQGVAFTDINQVNKKLRTIH